MVLDDSVSPDLLRALQYENGLLKDENRALREKLVHLRHAIRAMKHLQDTLQLITPETNIITLLNNILSVTLDAVDSENGSLLLLDEETDELVFVEAQGPNRDQLIGYRCLPVGQGIAGWVVSRRTPELVADVRLEPRFSSAVDQTIGFQTTSLICVPLIHDDQVKGAVEVVNTRTGDPFTEEDLDILVLLAKLVAEALALAEIQEE